MSVSVDFENIQLYAPASGVVTVTSVGDEIISMEIKGRATASQSSRSIVIGKLKYYQGGTMLFPVAAVRQVRDRDTVMQIDPDGKILLLNVVAGTEYTFHQPVPFVW